MMYVLSEYLTPFWFAMLLNEYEIEFMFKKFETWAMFTLEVLTLL
jgi:hypothetical protein